MHANLMFLNEFVVFTFFHQMKGAEETKDKAFKFLT